MFLSCAIPEHKGSHTVHPTGTFTWESHKTQLILTCLHPIKCNQIFGHRFWKVIFSANFIDCYDFQQVFYHTPSHRNALTLCVQPEHWPGNQRKQELIRFLYMSIKVETGITCEKRSESMHVFKYAFKITPKLNNCNLIIYSDEWREITGRSSVKLNADITICKLCTSTAQIQTRYMLLVLLSMLILFFNHNCIRLLTLTLPGPSAGVSGSLDSYCSLKPLCSGMGEVVPARTSPTLLPPCPSIRALCYSNCQRSTQSHQQSKG